MAKKKLLSGTGWSFEPADVERKDTVQSLPDAEQKATLRLEKRAKGKEVTVLSGFVLSDPDRKALAAGLKKRCGTGGGEAPGSIELQGDHRDQVRSNLIQRGWKMKG
ncbi:MAG: translation initiation factor [Planctomycetes bacterium]|nr:translation initiation factor [Planctomycetota bacterium]